ncbi:DNA polymerase III subunit beta, partial [Oleiphilus sp. HI0009]
IENKSNLPVLGNVLINAKGSELSITGSNLEVEMIAVIHNVEIKSEGSVTVPAKKLNDICKSFSNDSDIKFSLKDGKALVRSGKSRFTLTTLPSDQYPNVNLDKNTQNITMQANELKRIIDATSFSMGVQDVRYYLNGLLLDVNGNKIKAVSTDGHRLSISEAELTVAVENPVKAIIPRKAISEIAKLLTSGEEVTLKVSENQATINVDNYTFTTKLIDGTFPNYEQVIPKGGDKSVKADRELLKSVLQRASILSHENIKGVQLTV